MHFLKNEFLSKLKLIYVKVKDKIYRNYIKEFIKLVLLQIHFNS